MMEKRASTRASRERPAEGVLHRAGPIRIGIDLPQFLEADSVFLRVAALVQLETLDDSLC